MPFHRMCFAPWSVCPSVAEEASEWQFDLATAAGSWEFRLEGQEEFVAWMKFLAYVIGSKRPFGVVKEGFLWKRSTNVVSRERVRVHA